jgi:hypothetical protein
MGNQQAKDTDTAWLAGFIDGEGCLDFVPSHVVTRGRPYLFHYPRVRVSNCDKKTLDDVCWVLEGLGMAYHVSWRHPKNGTDRPSWSLGIQGINRVERFLAIMYPFLRTKAEQCRIMQAWIQLRRQHVIGNQYRKDAPYSAQELALMADLKRLKRQ